MLLALRKLLGIVVGCLIAQESDPELDDLITLADKQCFGFGDVMLDTLISA